MSEAEFARTLQADLHGDLGVISGIGPRKLGQYGAAVFALVGGESLAEPSSENFGN